MDMDYLVLLIALLVYSIGGLAMGILAMIFNKKLATEFYQYFSRKGGKIPLLYIRLILYVLGTPLLYLGLWAAYHLVLLFQ